jgi:hypothetical protein
MSPRERQEFEELKQTVASLTRVEHIPFIQNIKRRVIRQGIVSRGSDAAISINESVRNAAGTGTEAVAKDYDEKVEVTLSDGTTRFIGVYSS